MTWSARHKVLAAIRDMLAVPLGATLAFYCLGLLFRPLYGGSTNSYCDGGGTLFLIGLLVWAAAIAASVRFTGFRGPWARLLIVFWNLAVSAFLLIVVFLGFLIGVGGCSD